MSENDDFPEFEEPKPAPSDINRFADCAPRYYEMSYSVIPVLRMAKRPSIDNWQIYSDRLPTQEEMDQWCKVNHGANIGLVCGPASGVMALDLDDDALIADPRLPRSPIVRKGKKGEVRFFKWRADSRNIKANKVEIFHHGCQVLIPESVHPETKVKYYWSIGNLDDRDLLPDFPYCEDEIERIFRDNGSNKEKIIGRNNKLKAFVSAMCFNKEPIEKAVSEAINYDRRIFSKNRLFLDKDEPYWKKGGETETGAAMSFVESIYKSTKPHVETGETLSEEESEEVPDISIEDSVIDPPPFRDENIFLTQVAESISKSNEFITPALSMSGALGIGSALCLNRFALQTNNKWLCPNLFIYMVCGSGGGKGAPLGMAKRLLEEHNLVGSGGYKSGTATLHGLPETRQRLDVIDEITSQFKTMIESSSPAQTDMVEVLCQLFSVGGEKFLFPSSMSSKREGTPRAVWNPQVSILGATTYAGLQETYPPLLIEKGLYPRFLFCPGKNMGLNLGPFDYDLDYLKNFVKDFVERYPIQNENGDIDLASGAAGDMPRVFRNIPFSRAMIDVDLRFRQQCYDEIMSYKNDRVKSAFASRKREVTLKLALIDAALCEQTEIDENNFFWASEMYNWSYNFAINILDNMIIGRASKHFVYSEEQDRLAKLIERSGERGLLHGQISSLLRNVEPSKRHGLIDGLVQSNIIVKSKAGRTGNGFRYYLKKYAPKNV